MSALYFIDEGRSSTLCEGSSQTPRFALALLLQSRLGGFAGLNSVIAGRNLTCPLSSLHLAGLAFFLPPKCLVETRSPVWAGADIRYHVISHVYLGVNVVKSQVLIVEMTRENMKVLTLYESRKGEKYASGKAPAPKACASSLPISSFLPRTR